MTQFFRRPWLVFVGVVHNEPIIVRHFSRRAIFFDQSRVIARLRCHFCSCIRQIALCQVKVAQVCRISSHISGCNSVMVTIIVSI